MKKEKSALEKAYISYFSNVNAVLEILENRSIFLSIQIRKLEKTLEFNRKLELGVIVGLVTLGILSLYSLWFLIYTVVKFS